MIGKIKSLGIALVAVAVLSMVAASAVQASEVHITSGASTSIFGKQTAQIHKFQLTKPGVNTQCTQVLFEATQTGSGGTQTTTQDLTLTATYTGCTCFGVACQIKMNGCKYTITGEAGEALTAKVDITGCTAGLKIELVSALGTVTVPEQAAAGHILLANEGAHPNGSLAATIALQGIKYQCDGAIPNCANGTQTTDGDYTGQATFEGKADTGGVEGSSHNGHTYQKLNQGGALVGLVATPAMRATEFHITSGASTSIFGKQTAQIHKFQLTKPGVNTQCTQVLFEATQTGSGGTQTTTQDLTLTATYTGCTCFGVACQIKMNGCKYTITGEGPADLTAKVDVTGCTAGLKIELVSALGTVTVPEQAAAGHILLANEGAHPNGSLAATIALQGIKYQCDGAIPNCANGTQTTDGDYTGQATFEGKSDTGGVEGSSHNGHTYQKLNQGGALVGLVATSTVRESEFHITSGASTSIFGKQTAQIHKLQLTKPGINTQCAQVLFEATQTGSGGTQTTTQDLTLTATYTGCTCFGVACTIKMNGCKYTITGEGQLPKTAKADITGCTAGQKVELVSAFGTVTVGEQGMGGHVLFENEGVHPNGSLTATIALQGITYECDGGIPNCANGTQTTDGDYTGQATFEGKADTGGVEGSSHNGHTYQKLNQGGALVGLVVT